MIKYQFMINNPALRIWDKILVPNLHIYVFQVEFLLNGKTVSVW